MARTVGTHWRGVGRERKNRCKHPNQVVGKAAAGREGVTRSETKVAKHA